MRSSDLQREENYNEYLRLLQNEDYLDVTLDEESGGVSAVHKLHKFGKQKGSGGLYRGDYERISMAVLRKAGHRIVLEEETNTPGVKSFDGYLDDVPMEIKAIEGNGTWAICSKLRYAEKQHAQCVVLFFPDENCYSPFRVSEGLRLFLSSTSKGIPVELSKLIIIVQDRFVALWNKKATPIEGWSIQEGLRR